MRRFSLKTLLFLCLGCALLFSIISLTMRERSLRQEVLQLRAEAGHLVPIDRSQVNLIAVPQKSENVWQWRVYAPEHVSFDIGMAVGDVPPDGVPDVEPFLQGAQIPSSENSVLWTLTISPGIDGDYVLNLRQGNVASSSMVTDDDPSTWLEGTGSFSTAGTDGAAVYAYDKPIVLRRVRSWRIQ